MNLKRKMSILLSVCMILSSIPFTSFASEPAMIQMEEENVREATQSEADEAEAAQVVATESDAEKIPDEDTEIKTADGKNAEETSGILLEATAEDGMTVTLKADKEAFEYPEDLALEVTVFTEETDEETERQLEAKAENSSVARRVTYDVKVLYAGEEVQPAEGKKVRLEFEMTEIPSGADAVSVYHHNEETSGIETVIDEVPVSGNERTLAFEETAEAEAADEPEEPETQYQQSEPEQTETLTVTGETEGFSLYTVDFTYKEKRICIDGGTDHNELSGILSTLGITESIENAIACRDAECTEPAEDNTVKNKDGEDLYKVYEENDVWYLDALNAFATEHGLLVETENAEYKIKVTDEEKTQETAIIVETQKQYQTVQAAMDNATEGQTVKLLSKATENVTVKKSVSLDLNGKALIGDGTGSVITLNGDSDTKIALKITDSSAESVHKFTVGDDGLWTLTDETETAAVALEELTKQPEKDDVIAVKGGVITGGKTARGAGIYVSPYSSITMDGGVLCGNEATDIGGGVYIASYINTGEGVFIGQASFTGAVLAGNTAVNGGAIGLDAESDVLLNGCVVRNNTAGENGGGIYKPGGNEGEVGYSKSVLLDTEITGNCAKTGHGGGVYYQYYEGDSCFAAGTQISMADGTAKKIEDITEGDLVKTFDHETGLVSCAKVYLAFRGDAQEIPFTLSLEDGFRVSIAGCHDLLEKETRKYVTLTAENAMNYIGKSFYGEDGKWHRLLSVNRESTPCVYYSIYTSGHQNCYANGLLSVADDVDYLLNIYELDEDLKADEEQLKADIEKFGYTSFEYINENCGMSREWYEDAAAGYLAVAVGKGLITEEEVKELYESICDALDADQAAGETKETAGSLTSLAASAFAFIKGFFVMTAYAAETPSFSSFSNGYLYIGSGTEIVHNTAGSENEEENVYLLKTDEDLSLIYLVGTDPENINVGVTSGDIPTAEQPVQITINGKEKDEEFFFSDNRGFGVQFNEEGYFELTAKKQIVIADDGTVTYQGVSASDYSANNYIAINKMGDFGDSVEHIKTEENVANPGTSITLTGVRGIDAAGNGKLSITSIKDGMDIANNGHIGAINAQSSSSTTDETNISLQGIGGIKVKASGNYGAKGFSLYYTKNPDITKNKFSATAKSLSVESEAAAYAIQGSFAGRTTDITITEDVTVNGKGTAYGTNLTAGTPAGNASLNFGTLTVNSEAGSAYGIHCAGGAKISATLNGDMNITAPGKTAFGFRAAGDADISFGGKDDKEINVTVTGSDATGAQAGGSKSIAKLKLNIKDFTVESTGTSGSGAVGINVSTDGAESTGTIKTLSVKAKTDATAIDNGGAGKVNYTIDKISAISENGCAKGVYSNGGTVALKNAEIYASGSKASQAVYAEGGTVSLTGIKATGDVIEANSGAVQLFGTNTVDGAVTLIQKQNVAKAADSYSLQQTGTDSTDSISMTGGISLSNDGSITIIGAKESTASISGGCNVVNSAKLSLKNAAITGDTVNIANSGVIEFDMTDATEKTITLIDYTGTSDPGYGTAGTNYKFATGKSNGYVLVVENKDLVAKQDISTCTLTAIADQLYDGSAKTPETTVKDGTVVLVKGTDYTVAFSSNTDAGTASVAISGIGNYGGTLNGQFTITPRKITATSASGEKVYDGTALTDSKVTESGDGFVSGEGVTYTVTGSRMIAGTSSNTFSIAYKTGTKAQNYSITKSEGTLKVTPIKTAINITAGSGSKKYDGTALTESSFTYTQGVLLSGDTLSVTTSGSVTNVGTAANKVTGYSVKRGDTEVTGCYTFGTSVDGTLEVTKRSVTMTSGSGSKVYDGTPLTQKADPAESGDGFITGEGVSYTVTGSQTIAGTSKNTFSYTWKAGTLAGNYDISKTEGSLTVTAISSPIVITAGSSGKKYDGTALTNSGYTYTDGILKAGDTLTATVSGTITDVGTAANKVTSFAVKRGDQDVTSCYTFGTSADGTLTVTKRSVTLTSGTANKTYDGTPLTNGTVTPGGDGFITGEGAAYNVTGSQTVAGASENKFDYTLAGTTKASNYDITTVYGILTINKITTPIIITAGSNSKMYDGTALTDNSFSYTKGVLVSGDTLSAVTSGTITNAGTAANKITGYSVKRGDADVTDCYTFGTSADGTLTVTPITTPIIITAASGSKKYDGTALTDSGFTYTTGIVVSGDRLTAVTTGAITEVGTAANKITDYKVLKGSTDVTGCYTFGTSVDGTLEITKRSVTMTSGSASKKYDGKPLVNQTEPVESGDGFVSGEGVEYEVTGSQTEEGSSNNTFEYTAKAGTDLNNYSISKVEGILTVEKKVNDEDDHVKKNTGTWGAPVTGTWAKTFDGKWSYKNTDSYAFKSTWGYIKSPKTGASDWYYFGEDGYAKTGFQTINGKTYYFRETKDERECAMATGWQTINGRRYHFSSEKDATAGALSNGWLLDADGSWYHLDKNQGVNFGVMQTGWFIDPYDKHTYYLDPKTGKMHTGRVTIGGVKYYFNENVPGASGWSKDTNGEWVYEKRGIIPFGALIKK